MKRRLLCSTLLALALVGACKDEDRAAPPMVAGADADVPDVRVEDAGGVEDAAPDTSAPLDAADCTPVVESPPILPPNHAPEGTPLTYPTNPPTSGTHYPIWADFQEYDRPIPDGYLVHSMEHGAVLLLYKCEGDACPSMVAALRAIRDAVPTDPLCRAPLRVRVILAPRPANDVAIEAAAWGHLYRASCVDPTSLARFVNERYAKGPPEENFCAPGSPSL